MNTKRPIIGIYKGWAKNYDFINNIYFLVGYRMKAYRKKAIASLNLKQGDTVVDLACGTGLNFPYLQKAVGVSGKIIGVDISDAMLEEAKKRVETHGWKNVELIHSDVEKYKLPNKINAVLSTLALSYIPNYDALIKKIHSALPVNGKFAELSFKPPKWGIIRWLQFRVLRSFFSSEDSSYKRWMSARIWKSVERYFGKTDFKEFYFGTTYLVTGEKRHK